MQRRTFLRAALTGAAAFTPLSGGAAPAPSSLPGCLAADTAPPPANPAPDDERAWRAIAAAYPAHAQPGGVINLDYGVFGQMPLRVEAAFAAAADQVNAQGATFVRRDFQAHYQGVRRRIAAMINAAPEEIALTRNATEAMQALIGGYNRLRPGDAVLIADHDYDSMQSAMRWLTHWRGVALINLDLPSPATRQGLIDAYERVLAANPRIRLMLLTHLSHRDGLRLPLRDILDVARQHGVDALVDAAHAWGQGAVDMRGDGVEFAGFNLHKWIGAPLGVGAVYIRKERIADIDPYMDSPVPEHDPVLARVHTGTPNFAAWMAAAAALDFHQAIGSAACGARLKYLRDRWALAAREVPGISVLTPDDPLLCAGMTALRWRGATESAAYTGLARRLLEERRIFTVMRDGLAGGACLRVTPGFTTTPDDMDALLAGLRALV